MTAMLFYLLKLSISLSVVYLFYHLVLRRLTFYNWNRWYLVSYSLLSFFIPFIDISVVLDKNQWSHSGIVQWVPLVETNSINREDIAGPSFSLPHTLQLVLFAGMLIMSARLFLLLLSFRKMLRRASMIPSEGMKLYQVDEPIIPFSFGNAIFINRSLHTEKELSEIILHEFVHVKQKHSIDIIFSELLCLVNWYNPFAWLIRRSIRQNLEFIADNQVLQNGMDRKQYQYLLLKVIGNNHFSIAPKFNFSSLKKRIAMMNKMKSAGVHLVKFLFILPLVAVLLVAFRNQYQEKQSGQHSVTTLSPEGLVPVITDTVPAVYTPNSKGYLIDVVGSKGNCVVIVKDKNGKEIERVLLDEWKANSKFDEQYGEILPPPPAPPAIPGEPPVLANPDIPAPPAIPAIPAIPALPNPSGCWPAGNEVTAVYPAEAIGGHVNGLRGVATSYEINDHLATIELKDGSIEKYDLTRAEDKAMFESKYGKIITTSSGIGVSPALIAKIKGVSSTTSVAPGIGKALVVDEDYVYNITGNEDVLIRITKYTTKEQLEQYKTRMKEKGIDLVFSDIEYNDKGQLVVCSGRMKSKTGQSNFVADDFEVLILAVILKEDKTLFTVRTSDQKEPI